MTQSAHANSQQTGKCLGCMMNHINRRPQPFLSSDDKVPETGDEESEEEL